MRVSNYSDYLTNVSALMGVDQGGLEQTELTFLNTYFNKAIRKAWESQIWTDLCPYGEVRFPNNLNSSPYNAEAFNQVNTQLSGNVIPNPLDNRLTASQVLETNVSGEHYIWSTYSFPTPNVQYLASGYVRPNGRNYIQVTLQDNLGTVWATAVYNLNNPGSVGSVVNVNGTGATGGIQMQANGFYYWSLRVSAPAVVSNGGMILIALSPDGTTYTYLGDSTAGIFSWGNTLSTPSSLSPAGYIIPWDQADEQAIDVMFSAWANNPGASTLPTLLNVVPTPNGIQIIGPACLGPVYTYYRPQRPSWTGGIYDPTQQYLVGQQVYFSGTDGAGNVISNYYNATGLIAAGFNPPFNGWEVIPIPYIFLEYAVYSSYADWLEVEGQSAKAQSMRSTAQTFLDDENDRQERQQGNIMPWRVNTHLTSQNRGLGYQGQNFNAGTATIN